MGRLDQMTRCRPDLGQYLVHLTFGQGRQHLQRVSPPMLLEEHEIGIEPGEDVADLEHGFGGDCVDLEWLAVLQRGRPVRADGDGRKLEVASYTSGNQRGGRPVAYTTCTPLFVASRSARRVRSETVKSRLSNVPSRSVATRYGIRPA